MGWSRADLARRLETDADQIGQLEMDLQKTPENLSQTLELLYKQAEFSADAVYCNSMAEILFEEDDVLQVDNSLIRRKFLDR